MSIAAIIRRASKNHGPSARIKFLEDSTCRCANHYSWSTARCYPPENFLAQRVASQGLDNTADWDNIDQQVGTLADQIVAKIC